jgi:hypothetical protein
MIEEMQQNEVLRELIRQELLKNTLESIRFASLGLGSERIEIVEKIFSGDIDHGVCATNDVLRFIANKLNQPAYSLLKLPANWTSQTFIDKSKAHFEARSNASGLTPPRWLWRRV